VRRLLGSANGSEDAAEAQRSEHDGEDDRPRGDAFLRLRRLERCLGADAAYKGKRVRITGGIVDDIKKDILDQPYVTIGTGLLFEIPQVQCTLSGEQVATAARLNKGDRVTVTGEVSGLLMNVQMKDCEF
jgi:putative nucleic acid binding protein